jgi:xylosylprotein 4-beta-galactosyltransferase
LLAAGALLVVLLLQRGGWGGGGGGADVPWCEPPPVRVPYPSPFAACAPTSLLHASWWPTAAVAATAAHRLAVVLPYRNRAHELALLLPPLRARLAASGIAHVFVVVNQTDSYRFNRAALMNAGALAAGPLGADYLALHDVDRLPVDPALTYAFPGDAYVHLTPPWTIFAENADLYGYMGGVGLVARDTYTRIDGMASNFWGWGGEDDELRHRLRAHGVRVVRPEVPKARRPGAVRHLHDEVRHARDERLFAAAPDPERHHPTGLRTTRYVTTGIHACTLAVVSDPGAAAAAAGADAHTAITALVLDVQLLCDAAHEPGCLHPCPPT